MAAILSRPQCVNQYVGEVMMCFYNINNNNFLSVFLSTCAAWHEFFWAPFYWHRISQLSVIKDNH